jgi:hypothetical protein
MKVSFFLSSFLPSFLPPLSLLSSLIITLGWGQLRLSSVLPLPNKYLFDLYLDDYIPISSLTRHTYHLTLTDVSSTTPLRVTIAWVDPPNIVWAVKNLLNDLDLIVYTPSGDTLYGNSIIGDEFNTQERVSLTLPMVGDYKIVVQSKVFPTQSNADDDVQQQYSIVITSSGQVNEQKFKTEKISISDLHLVDSCATGTSVSSSDSGLTRVQFQLEDWYAGESFQNSTMTLAIVDTNTPSTIHSECSFIPNILQSKAEFTRTSQCSFCLSKKGSYTAHLITNHTLMSVGSTSGLMSVSNADIPIVIRAVSPQCEVYLSSYQPESTLHINGDGDCNICPTSSGDLTVTMYANVTDDDESQYSW